MHRMIPASIVDIGLRNTDWDSHGGEVETAKSFGVDDITLVTRELPH